MVREGGAQTPTLMRFISDLGQDIPDWNWGVIRFISYVWGYMGLVWTKTGILGRSPTLATLFRQLVPPPHPGPPQCSLYTFLHCEAPGCGGVYKLKKKCSGCKSVTLTQRVISAPIIL